MLELPLEELEALDKDLDVFRAARPVREELLRAGLHPPLPICGRLLIWGFPLLAASRAAGVRRLACVSLEGLSGRAMLSLALQLEDRPGGYLWSEKQRMLAFTRAAGFALGDLAPLLETHPDPRLEDKVESFSALPAALRALVDEGLLDLRTAVEARDLPAEILEAIRGSPLSFSELRSFLTLLRETWGKRQLTPEQTASLALHALSVPRPLEALAEQRSPVMTGLKRRWEVLEKELLAGSGLAISPPPFFEGEAFRVSFAFRSRRSLARKLRALARVEERCDELLAFLS